MFKDIGVKNIITITRRFKSQIQVDRNAATGIEMYLEDPGFRYAGRVLKICHGIVYQWIRKYEKKKELPQKKEPVKIVELDEIHIYVCQKKTAGGYGLQLTDMENGLSLLSVGPDQ